MPHAVAAVAISVSVLATCGSDLPPAAHEAAAEAAGQSAVYVQGPACRPVSLGSGVVIAPELVLTAAHVVAGNEVVRVGQDGQAAREATPVAFDPDLDLALVRADGLDAPVADFGPATTNGAGAVLGFTRDTDLSPSHFTVRRLIRANITDIYDDPVASRLAIELATEVEAGDSGGAVVDEAGRVIGILFARSRRDEAVAYATRSSEVEAWLERVEVRNEAVDTGECD